MKTITNVKMTIYDESRQWKYSDDSKVDYFFFILWALT